MSVILKGASFVPAWLTILDETTSFHTDVPSVGRMRLSLKQNYFFKRRTWIMCPTSFPVLWDRPFLALAVFLLQKYKENKLYAKSNKNLLMPCIFLMWQWVMLGNSFLLVKKKTNIQKMTTIIYLHKESSWYPKSYYLSCKRTPKRIFT